MQLLLVAALLGSHATAFKLHAYLLAHVVLVVFFLVLPTVCSLAADITSSVGAFACSSSSRTAHDTCSISITLPPSLPPACAVDD